MLRTGVIQQKILLLLAGGVTLSLSCNPRQQFIIISHIAQEWQKINQFSLRRAIRSLYESKLIDIREKSDGAITMILSEYGRKKILSYKLDELSIRKPQRWDRKWRMVIFDIPEESKKGRDAMRFHLCRLGFRQVQKSVFIFPYECRDEVEFLIEFYRLRSYVRQVLVEHIDNDLHLKSLFKLI